MDLRRHAAAMGLAESTAAAAAASSSMAMADASAPAAGARPAVSTPRAITLPAGALTDGDWALAAEHAEVAEQTLVQALAAFHARQPDELGPDAARLRRLALPRLPEPLFRALLVRLVAAGGAAVRGAYVHLPEHGVRLSASEERIAQKVAPRLAAAGFEGAWARDLARDSGESEPLVRTALARLAQRGELHQVVKDLYLPLPTMATLADIARQVAAASAGVVTAASFRNATQLGRKRAIQILEHFDRIGLTRRVGDEHRLRSDSMLFTADGDALARR
jgi:selenocysteine-specific elongation factor